VITRSADLARRLEGAGIAGEKLHTVYNGVDTGLFRPADAPEAAREKLGLGPNADALLFVGNFLPVKNPLMLLEAWRLAREKLPDRDLRLIMIGAGPMEAAIRGRAAQLGLQDALDLPGRLPSSAVADYLRAARCLVLSSHNEGVPNVVLEAMASGVPVVSTDVGGISEVLDAPFMGKLVPPGDGEALAEAIVEIVGSPSDRGRISARGEQYSWEATARRYLDLLRSGEGGTAPAGC